MGRVGRGRRPEARRRDWSQGPGEATGEPVAVVGGAGVRLSVGGTGARAGVAVSGQ